MSGGRRHTTAAGNSSGYESPFKLNFNAAKTQRRWDALNIYVLYNVFKKFNWAQQQVDL